MQKALSRFIIFFIFVFSYKNSLAQTPDFIMQGWYWNYPLYVTGEGNFIESLNAKGDALKAAGFTYVWVPPLAKGSSGYLSMGYDVKDYYDLGEYDGYCRWGNKDEYDAIKSHYNAIGLNIVADMIYNHRDGGNWEDNTAVEGWIENMTYAKVAAGDQPYPSDRYQCYLPLGAASGNASGTYYFKIHSASQHPNFFTKPYMVVMWTNTVAADYVTPPTDETEPNGGADCGETDNILELGKRINASIDNSGCGTDEFALTIHNGDFAAAGDTLWISMVNTGGGGLSDMSDHVIYGVWYAESASDIQAQVKYQTRTDFTSMPSGNGAMNYLNFKPNGNPTQLAGDLDAMLFYYDIDQNVVATQATLHDWTKWMWNQQGVRGFRMDAVKHFPAYFVGDLLDDLHYSGINPGMVVGEAYDFSPSYLKGWIDDVNSYMDDETKSDIQIRVFDFALRNNLDQACDAFGYDVRNIFNSGIVDGGGGSGFNVVTFINNHDFRDGDQPISTNPELAYAYILTNNKLGVPCVYYSDYYAPENLQYKINGLIQVHKKYIYGATQTDYLSRFSSPYSADYISGAANTSLLYQLSYSESGREVIVAINFSGNTLKVNQTINTANIFPGDTLTDIFSQTPTPYQLVQPDNSIYMEVPARSFAVWVQGDLTHQTIDISTPVALNNISSPQSLHIFPNPANDFITLQTTITIPMHIDLWNLEGKLILTIDDYKKSTLNISALPSGIYFIKIVQGNETFLNKFIKD